MLYVQSITLQESRPLELTSLCQTARRTVLNPTCNKPERRYLAHRFQKTYQIVSVLFLHREDSFQHAPRSRIVRTEIGNHFPVTVDRNAFSHQIFLDHIYQIGSFDVLRVTSTQQSFRIQIRFALELNYSLRNQVSMALFFVGMLQEFSRNTFRIDSRSHEVVPFVSEHTNNFRCQCLV